MIELSPAQTTVLLAAVGAVAFLYSSVGHGGATGYLAVMALLGVGTAFSRPGALWINCAVASIAAWRFQRAGFFDWRVFAPLAAASVPLAWLGSRLHFEGRPAAVTLGLTLLSAGWMLGWGRRDPAETPPKPARLPLALAAGGALGLLAGITGIGGGVFLTPLLIFLRGIPAKTAGGISALFIVVNSAAGLVGLGRQAAIAQAAFLACLLMGTLGAFVGTQFGVRRWSAVAFRRALAVVLWIAAVKLLFTGR